MTDEIDTFRDLVSNVVDAHLAAVSNRLNEVMRGLTAWAAILAVTTAITGFYGQNVPYPGYGRHWGWITSLVLLVGATTGLWLYFKRKRWI